MIRKMIVVLVVLFVGGAASCWASVDITMGVTIFDVSSEYNNSLEGPYSAEKLLISDPDSGRDINGPDTHSTVMDNYYSTGQHGTMWMASTSPPDGDGKTNEYVTFDLGQVYADLDYVKIWNCNIGWEPRAAKDIAIKVSTDGTTWVTDSSIVLSQAPGDDVTPFGDEVPITTPNVRYVKLDIADSYGEYIALSEVAFYAVPEPTTMSLLLIGGMAGMLRRRRQ